MNDQAVVAAQLDRELRAVSPVAVRCSLGLPVVVRVPPVLDDGTPFPTRLWLVCPLAIRRIGRIEGAGGVRAVERYVAAHPVEQARLESANVRYAEERDAALPPGSAPRPRGGVGGVQRGGVKCLHAHYADFAVGNDNPVGELVAPWVEPLDCRIGCVAEDEGGRPARNPIWREPS